MRQKTTYSRLLLNQYRNMQKLERNGVVYPDRNAEKFISELRLLVDEFKNIESQCKSLEAS